MNTFRDSLRRNFKVVGRHRDHNTFVCDCRSIRDPARDPELRKHIGTLPANLLNMIKQKACQKFFAELHRHTFDMLRRERNEHVCLILFCRSGRHRSVAVSYCLQYCVTLAGLESIGIHHASEGYYWRSTCGGCEDCKGETEQAKASLDTIHHNLEQQWSTHEDGYSLASLEESAKRSGRKGVKIEEAEAASSASAPSQPVPVKAMPHPQAESVEPPKDEGPAMPKPPSTPPPPRKIKSETNKQPEKLTAPRGRLRDVRDSEQEPGIDASRPSRKRSTEGSATPSAIATPARSDASVPDEDCHHSILDIVAGIRDEEKDMLDVGRLYLTKIYDVFCPNGLGNLDAMLKRYSHAIPELMISASNRHLKNPEVAATVVKTCFREILGGEPNKPGAASSGEARVARSGNVGLKENPKSKEPHKIRIKTKKEHGADQVDYKGDGDESSYGYEYSYEESSAELPQPPKKKSKEVKQEQSDDDQEMTGAPASHRGSAKLTGRAEIDNAVKSRRTFREAGKPMPGSLESQRHHGDADHPGARQDLTDMHCDPSEPDKLPAEFLDQVFDGQRKRKNFIVWLQSPYGGPSIRVNAKYAPKNTYVPVPDNLTWNRKTTMIQWEENGTWECFEYRTKMHNWKLPPKWDEQSSTAYVACADNMPELSANNPVMTKADRGILNSRNRNLTTRDRLLSKALTCVGALTMCLIAPSDFVGASGVKNIGLNLTTMHTEEDANFLETRTGRRKYSKKSTKSSRTC